MSLHGISCIGYLRVSTERQAGEAQTSLTDQRQAIEQMAARLRVTVGHWFHDDGASGATVEKRPALRSLIAACEASPRKASAPGLVLVLNDSRFGRFPDPEESTYWRQHLKRLGWVVRFVENDDSDNLTVRSVMRAIVSSQATQKREDVRANAKRGSRGTAAQGFWGSRTPYGYRRKVVYPAGRERVLGPTQRKAADEKVILTPEPDEAAIVLAMFTRYASGEESLATVTEWLRQAAPSRHWTRAAVRCTLANPAYVGDVVSGRVPSDKQERATTPTRPESAWVTHREAHPAIVSRFLFERVQEILSRNKKWTRRVQTTWLLSGLVRCPCGQPLVAGGGGQWRGEGANRRRSYSYRCASKAGIAADRCPYPCSVSKSWLEDAVLDTLAGFVGSPAQRKRLLAQLDAALAEMRSAPTATTASLDKEIADATTTRDRLVAAVADGTLTGEEAKSRLDTTRRLLGRLQAQREALQRDQATPAHLDTERDRLAALVLDFRRAAKTLQGPALRELVRPWIASAQFEPTTRVLTLDIRHIPAVAVGGLSGMAYPPFVDLRGRG